MKLSYQDQMLVWRKRRERALALRENGLSFAEIADAIGCSRQRVHQLLSNMKPQAKRGITA